MVSPLLRSVLPFRRHIGCSLILLAAACGAAMGQVVPKAVQDGRAALQREPVDLTHGPKYVSDRVLVRFRPGTSTTVMQAAHQAAGSAVLSVPPVVDRLQVVKLAANVSVHQAIRVYRRNPAVLYAEPDYIVQAGGVPNDPGFTTQWNMRNTGQAGGTTGADIHAPQAWDLSTGSAGVVVAVIDTGIDYNHPDLAANVWSAPAGFTVTTFGGAQIQCAAGVHGFNAVAGTCDPLDDNSHGTHVSGIIGATGNNGVGVAGVNWNVQILPCKFLNDQGLGAISDAITCLSLIKQLKDSGINIVVSNNSWGGGGISQALIDAVNAQMQDGILFVAAAGNEFSDNDLFPAYPANIFLPNVISVAASTRVDDIVAFSNLGRHTVHVSAPGLDILSTTPNNTYSVFSGTSMAAPHVTGVAALLKAQDPARDWRAIKNLILAGGDTLAAMSDTITQKRLNAFGAMTCANSVVQSRLQPVPPVISSSAGSPILLAMLNINCAQPAGGVTVQVTPGNQTITLTDDGTGNDQAAGDGVYTGQFTPAGIGNYQLQFSDGSTVSVEVLSAYGFVKTTSGYLTIAGTNLNLGDDSVAQVNTPFPVRFGGAQFSKMFVSSNGTISFTDPYGDFVNRGLGAGGFPNFVQQPTTLVAPWWEDLFPVKATAQNVFWAVTGTAPTRQLVVEWRNVRSFLCRSDSGTDVTFEAVFNESTDDILFNYSDTVFAGNCAFLDHADGTTIGIQSSPTSGSMWNVGDGEATGNGTSLLWQSPPPALPVTPVPVMGSISPSNGLLSGPDVNLTVTGSGFVPSSLVMWDRITVPTTFVSGTQLNAILPANLLTPDAFPSQGQPTLITVLNPAPGGGTSSGLFFSLVTPTSVIPTITSVSPNTVVARRGPDLTITVTGANLTGSTVFWGLGVPLNTTVISDTQVTATMFANLLVDPGTAPITVHRQGIISNALPFTVTPAAAAGILSVDATGKATSGTPASKLLRFLGWNYAGAAGPDYLRRFARPYGSAAPPSQSPAFRSAASPGSSVSPSISLTAPGSLPGFGFHPTLPAGYLPTSVTTGDFNQDGKMDWIVSNGGSNDLWLYLGRGDGTAQLPIIIPCTGAAPLQVIAADLRKIGVLDLVVAEADSQTIGVFLGHGDGTFDAEVSYFVPRPPLSIAVADFNGDGHLDIAVGLFGDEFSGPFATLPGDGTGKFGRPLTYLADNVVTGSYVIFQMAAGDLNGDGLPDLAVIDVGLLAGAHSYLARGDGTFKHADYFAEDSPAASKTAVVMGDMDEDGCLDVVAVDAIGIVDIYKGTCDGNFGGFNERPPEFLEGAGDGPVSMALADMNGDGHLDVVTAGAVLGEDPLFGQEAGNLVTVIPGDGHGKLGLAHVYRSEPSMFGLALADLNGDGHPDVIVASEDTDTSSVFMNDGLGGLPGPAGEYIGYLDGSHFGTTNAPFSDFFFRDIDGDGKPDLALVEQQQFLGAPWELAVMLNDGTGHFGPAIRSPMGPGDDFVSGYVLGDFRNTSRPDLLVSLFDPQTDGAPAVLLFPNTGQGHFGPQITTQLDPSLAFFLSVVAAGDFNGDGKLDFVISSIKPLSTGMQMTVFLGNGDGTFQQGATQLFAAGLAGGLKPAAIFTGDFNHDGKLDVLIQIAGTSFLSIVNDNVYEFLGNGDGTFQPGTLLFRSFGSFTVADLNHDGIPDIVEFIQPLDKLVVGIPYGFNIHLAQGDGTFQLAHSYTPYPGLFEGFYTSDNGLPSQQQGPMVADFNGDGNLDLAAFQSPTSFPAVSYLQILAGNGDGSFTPTFSVTPFHKRSIPTTAVDVNGDGRADLIEVDGFASSFHVIPSVPGPALQLSIPVQPIIGTHGTLVVTQSLIATTPTSVLLSASDVNITIQPSVTIPAGSLSVSVPFTIGPNFNASRVFSLTAQLGTQMAVIYSYQTTTAFSGVRIVSLFSKETVPPSGTSDSYSLTLLSYGGYTTTVQLSCQGLPAGASCVFDRTSAAIQPGGNGVPVALSVQAGAGIPLGAYTFQVVATDGAMTALLQLNLLVADYSVTFSPVTATAQVGTRISYTLTINPIGGWTDFVAVNCQVSPSNVFCPFNGAINAGPGSLTLPIDTTGVPPGDYTFSVSATAHGVTHNAPSSVLHVRAVPIPTFSFIPVTPCRIADTRNAAGPFGGPFLHGQTARAFAIPSSACGIPATAAAYSINATVVPHGTLGFLTLFPCGQALPLVSTLNSIDGRIKAVAAIVPAGQGGAVCAFVTHDTEFVLDINGYFGDSANPQALAFYPVTPCRLVDTRLAAGPLGGPSMVGNASGRTFPIHSSPCNVPPAQAYSLNFTSVPKGQLGFLTTWPAGQTQPLVSTLNAPTGAITANAAIVPAGTNGDINVFVTHDSDLVIDINGYFAPPAAGGLVLYTIPPCRVLDTRNPAPTNGNPFSGTMNVNVAGSGCGAPATAQSFVLNATVIPPVSLGFLTLWPQGSPQPLVSSLNAPDGAITSNMAIVPTANGSISAFGSTQTHLILDISGYFAPPQPAAPTPAAATSARSISVGSAVTIRKPPAVKPASQKPNSSQIGPRPLPPETPPAGRDAGRGSGASTVKE